MNKSVFRRLLVCYLLLILGGCATFFEQKYEGHYKIGDPYTINDKTYIPHHNPAYEEVGQASWYGDDFHGKKTANGERFNKHAMTAAHRTLPLPSFVRVTNLENGKHAMVMVNDRGPFAKNRILDLSEKAAKSLGMKETGIAKVKVQYLKEESDKLVAELKLQNQKNKVLASHIKKNKNLYAQIEKKPSLPKLKTSEKLYVQVDAYKDKKLALSKANQLKKFGKAEIKPVTTKKGTLYQVAIGPIKTHKEADSLLKKIVNSGHKSSFILAKSA